jgi:hypothetical protein
MRELGTVASGATLSYPISVVQGTAGVGVTRLHPIEPFEQPGAGSDDVTPGDTEVTNTNTSGPDRCIGRSQPADGGLTNTI